MMSASQNERRVGASGVWRWLAYGVVPLAGVLVWLWGRRADRAAMQARPREITLPTPWASGRERQPLPPGDDLSRIEGIGPKISRLLRAGGIRTFSELGETPPERLRELLDGAHLTLADPATWPEQARLAAANDWEALDTLQRELIGGRRV